MIHYADPKQQGSIRKQWSPLRATVRAVLMIIAAIFAIGLLTGILTLGMPVLGFFNYWALPAALTFILTMGVGARRTRRRRATIILSYIEQAVRMNFPLAPWLAAAQRSEEGKVHVRLGDLRELLQSGASISSAVDYAVPEASDRQIAMIGAGERLGRLPQFLKRLVDEERGSPSFDTADESFSRVYPIVLLIFVALVISMVAVFVMPKFHAIFMDFRIKLPWITMTVMNVGVYLAVPAAILCTIIIVGMVAKALNRMFSAEPRVETPWRRPLDWLIWKIPFFGEPTRNRQMADACEVLAEGLGSGIPLDQAIAEAAVTASNLELRHQLMNWNQFLIGGMPPAIAAERAGLPRMLVGMLGPARQAHGAADAFRFLARYYDARFSRARMLLRGAMVPIVVLILAGVVLAVQLALFLPLINLIDGVLPYLEVT